MDTCFWKKVLAVIIGLSLISFITQGLTAILNRIVVEDTVSGILVHVPKLVNINFAVFSLLVLLVIAMFCVNLIKRKKLRFGLEGVVYVLAIVVMIIGIIRQWDFRDEMSNGESNTFYVTSYQKWQTYFSNLLSIVFYAFSTFTCIFTSSLLGCKKEEK